ncbi:MAG: HAD-IIA family hydrolase [Eubacteriales bacterium]|jgi:HAD superfamily hydrolase (TIGR01450 family)|nr:HAD-IIA family hydrolase [Eubacteriales bacterium]
MDHDAAALTNAICGKKLFLLDMDGTLYLGGRLFPHTLAFLKAVRDAGAQYLFLTNNSSKGADAYVNKLIGMGINAVEDDFFTSTDAACAYLEMHYTGDLIYALGTESFKQQLRKQGFPITDVLSDGIDCLLMGYDTELTYRKLEDASILLDRGVTYLATNPDWVCPTEFGYVPDCGSFAQALEHATGRLPLFLGKPKPEIALLAMAKKGVKPDETVLIGDRIYTDIACGKNAGILSVLVFSGETTPKILAESTIKPDFAIEGVEALLASLNDLRR